MLRENPMKHLFVSENLVVLRGGVLLLVLAATTAL